MITEALVMNNEGVSYLLSGRPQQALLHFKQSLHLLDNSLRFSPSGGQQILYANLNELFVLTCGTPFLGKTMDSNADFHLYDSAIALTRPRNETNPYSNIAFYTACTMLNLALGVHQMGLMAKQSVCKQDQARSSGFLLKADRLYQSVLKVMDVSIQENHTAFAAVFRFFSLAAQNNRLGIALELEVAPETCSALKLVMDQMIDFIKAQGCSDTGYEETYLNEFFLNSTLLGMTQMLKTLAAPCA